MIRSVSNGVAVVLVLGAAYGTTLLAQSSVVFRLRIPATARAYEPVTVRFNIENGTEDAVRADLGWNQRGALAFRITKPDGSVVTARAVSPPLGGLAAPNEVTVASRDSYEGWIILNEWVDLSAAGLYSLAVTSDAVVVSARSGATLSTARAWNATLLVTETTDDDLRSLCARLAQEANPKSSFEAGQQASVALASVRHSIAVPYLEAVARQERWAWIVVPALERLPGPDATRALQALSSLGGDAGALAKGALKRR